MLAAKSWLIVVGSKLIKRLVALGVQKRTLSPRVADVGQGKQSVTLACLAAVHASEATPPANTLIQLKARLSLDYMLYICRRKYKHWRKSSINCRRSSTNPRMQKFWYEVEVMSG
jgi:hypothetical protein